MPPKGSVSTKLAPMRLPPLRRLKVRNPNAGDGNPCLAIMSSVLSMQSYFPWINLFTKCLLMCISMLGFSMVQCRRMSSYRDSVENVYGCTSKKIQSSGDAIMRKSPNVIACVTETDRPEEEYNQLPSFEDVSKYCWAKEEEVILEWVKT